MSIADAGETLRDLLRTELTAFLNPGQIALRGPAQPGGNDVRLTLFLYAAIESPFLKNVMDQRGGPSDVTRRSPLTLDLYYLLTAYPPPTEPDPSTASLSAHQILAEAMRVFYEHGVLSGTRLRGALAARDDYALRLSLNPVTVEDMTRLWGVFPNETYQVSVSYLATPVPIEPLSSEFVQRVVQSDVHPHLLEGANS